MKNNALKIRPRTAAPTYPCPPEPPPAPKRSAGSRLLRVLLMFIFGTWMFAFGVIVGRETVPVDVDINPMEARFSALKSEEMAADRKQLEEGLDTLLDADLEFYKELKSGSTVPPENLHPNVAPAKPPETKKPVAKKALSVKRIEPPVEVAKPAPAPPPAPKSKPAAEPAPKVTGGETGDFAIQVASFGSPMDAERLVERLRANGFSSAYQSNEDVPGVGMRFRVKLGYFPSKPAAEGVLKKIVKEENLIDAYIFHRK